ncbi:subtilisin-like protein [Gymnopus androsaceus JB14]|uniref:tripeptidyl-peptidase II n=1 Tax=Gymnopus androsaceus JB14 TaxID=1447944 RepID=A0A6A4I9B3_9AGAR|nr:subtilisin-like protein [Gymnopus androsaceus JB14]
MLLQRSFKFLLLLTLACTGVLASPNPSPVLSPFVLHERRSHVPSGWSLSRRHDSSATIPLRFGLKQSNTHRIDEYLYDVSHPSSANYGKHWTAAQVAAAFAPSDETIGTVRNWLFGSGISLEKIRLSASKGWLEVEATVEQAEELMNTEYHIFEHSTGQEHIACDEYHLPHNVAPHVEIVLPSVHFDAIIEKRSSEQPARTVGLPGSGNGPKKGAATSPNTNSDLSTCDEEITVDCLKALYNISYTPVSGDTNTYGIVEYTPEAVLKSDLDMFFAVYAPDLVGVYPTEFDIDGGVQQTEDESFDFNGEPSLDLEYAMALVTSAQNITLYQVGDLVQGASFNNLLDALDASYCTYEGGDDSSEDGIYPDDAPGGFTGPEACGTITPAFVISTSYSYDEADLTPFYTSRQCNEYAKLGLMGVTMLYSSGDYGVAGAGGVCLNADGTQTTNGTLFNPTFPGTCPYITSVGATQINPGSTISDPESACEQIIFSGGGFSNYFSIPSYQQSVVQSFLDGFSSDNFTTANFNSSGTSRSYPDLSANGANYVIAVDGEFELVYGTSASSPVVGSMITLVNDARIAAGKAPVGFLNPTIYDPSFASVFNDITSGGNQGCGTVGFTATEGWDPVTGLGTPNLGLLMEAYLALP